MPPPRRIAFCITSLGIGGAERCLTNLVTRLPREKFACEVHVLQPRPDGQELFVQDLEKADIRIFFHNARRVTDAPRVVRSLARAWSSSRPVIVQSMLFHANIAAGLALRRCAGVLHVTGIRAAQRTANWRVKSERLFVRTAVKHVCVSNAVADYARNVGHLPSSKIVVIPNGVDLRQFRDASPKKDASFRPITFVGRIDEQKNILSLIRQSPRFLQQLPQHGLTIVGGGPLAEQAYAAARGMESRIQFIGHCTDIPGILKGSELLVLPSLWEGMPNVVLEAMAAGLPVVATDVEGVRELLGPRAGEQIVPIDDMAALADRIVAILRQPQVAADLGAANAARAAAEFSVETMVERYIELYDELLRASSS